jgi:nucleoside-diphosphate-sugar epimerase
MRVFLLAAASKEGLGYAVGQRLLAVGHSVAALVQSVPANWNWGAEWVVGQFGDRGVQQEMERADAVIDADLPLGLGFESTKIADRRPFLLRRALKGSGKPLIMTSTASVLGDTDRRQWARMHSCTHLPIMPTWLAWRRRSAALTIFVGL